MRSTTNLLIINLAIADILFVFFCVPFTAFDYVLPTWPFGNFWCKIVSGRWSTHKDIDYPLNGLLTGPIHDRGDVPRKCLYVGADVPRQIPGRGASHSEHVDQDRAQCFYVSINC